MEEYKTVVPAGFKSVAQRFWQEAQLLPSEACWVWGRGGLLC